MALNKTSMISGMLRSDKIFIMVVAKKQKPLLSLEEVSV